jgi:hypothetical protein
VWLEVFDAGGRRVARTPPALLGAGPHRLVWSGLDAQGQDAGPGVWWARVSIGERALVQKVSRLK